MPGPFDKEAIGLGDYLWEQREEGTCRYAIWGPLGLTRFEAAHTVKSCNTGRNREKYHLSLELELKFYFKHSWEHCILIQVWCDIKLLFSRPSIKNCGYLLGPSAWVLSTLHDAWGDLGSTTFFMNYFNCRVMLTIWQTIWEIWKKKKPSSF